MNSEEALSKLLEGIPQQNPFRFVDKLLYVDENTAKGTYKFKKDEFYYKGHFPELPITPSVILIESMAQIGMIPLGAFNYKQSNPNQNFELIKPIFTTSNVKFSKPVFPEDEVTVVAEKIYFRLNKLKAKVKMTNQSEEVVCSGELSGIFVDNKDIKF